MSGLLNRRIYRKCLDNEVYFYDACECVKVIYTFQISSEIRLLDEKSLVKEATDEWKQVNPLLSCEVLSLTNDNNNRHFVFVEENEARIENVFFLRYEIPAGVKESEKVTQAVWQLLSEQEANTPFEYHKRLLWKLLICQFSNNENEYHIMFVVNHSIVDGRSVHYAMLDLFRIIQAKHEKNYTRKEPISNCAAELNSTALNMLKGDEQKIINRQCPKFIDIAEAVEQSKSDSYFYDLLQSIDLNSTIRTEDNKVYFSLDELLKQSKQFNTKLNIFTFEKEKLEKLLMKCRKEKVKLNGCLNVAAILAMKMLYMKMNEEKTAPIYYMNAVSLRRESASAAAENGIGFKVNNLLFIFEDDLPDESLWLEKFWIWAKGESDKMHERILNGEHFRLVDYSNIPSGNLFANHFFISNVGPMSATAYSEPAKSLIEVRQRFAQVNFSKDSRWRFFYISVLTLNGALNFSILTNSHFVSVEQKNIFLDNFKSILSKIIE